MRINGGNICLVVDIVRNKKETTAVVCKAFKSSVAFFEYPCSSLNLRIAVVSQLDDDTIQVNVADVLEKLVLLPKSEGW